ncbi:MAG: IS1182 family transposase [Ignavibacteriales bacterium]|nr:IS1182 family transposase [Ignavibacteriales bacterium]
MEHKQGSDRNQLIMFSLESAIPEDSFVRIVDAFVDSIDLKSFGFAHVECKEEGRPPYHPAILLKLFLYGYHYGIRTTRKLEREAQTNMECMWLLTGLRPKYKTIADFRKDHCKAFREVFRRFVWLLKQWNLVEGQTIAIDSFKIRASNSLKKNFNEKKLRHHLEYIDSQIRNYEEQLERNDQEEEERKEIESKIEERKEKRSGYEKIRQDLKASREDQISITDPDSRAVVLLRNIVNVGYNIQASSDAKHKLLVDYDTGSVNDTHALAPMAIHTKELLQAEHLTVLADKGYHTGEQIEQCRLNNITTYVSPRASSFHDNGLYPISLFTYQLKEDQYRCPEGKLLKTNGRWHHHNDAKNMKSAYRFKRYTTSACKQCISRLTCTSSRNGRYIDRSEYAEALENNTKRVLSNPEYYRQRQQITEHQFGTLKRQRGFTHTNVRGKEKVLGEVGLMFTGYNLKRCVSILGVAAFIKALKECCLLVSFAANRLILSLYEAFLFFISHIENAKNKIFYALSINLNQNHNILII